MLKELGERLKFFGEIVGDLIIDALFFSVWALISSGLKYAIAVIYVAGDVPTYIKYPMYTFEYTTAILIMCFVILDIIRSLKKLKDLLMNSLKSKKRNGGKGKKTK